ncbi:hypothetical protein TNCV_4585341 [Trichonephila clavipes]|nr:hypothetical protein TNCV_4585341 [Trichonephila clavipes]
MIRPHSGIDPFSHSETKGHAFFSLIDLFMHIISTQIIRKFVNSCPLDENDWIEFVRGYNNKQVESEVQLLTADLISKGLKFATGGGQHFLTHDPDIERDNKKLQEALNNERNSSFE